MPASLTCRWVASLVEDGEHDFYRDRDRGAKAGVLLETPLLVEMFDGLEAAYIDAWKKSPPGADADRERAWMAVRIISEVRDGLLKIVTDGDFAAHALDALHPNKLTR